MLERSRHVRLIAAAGLAAAVAGCAGPKPVYDYGPPPPPPARERAAAPRPAPPRAAPTAHAPEAHSLPPVARAQAAIAPSGPSGPLSVARVSNYIDALEVDLRRHVHGAAIARQGDNVAVTIRNDKLFTPDGGVAGDDILEPLAAVLKGYVHTTVAVGSYTDTAGKPEQNMAVSQRRARQIAEALAREGVDSARITAQGYGATHLRVNTGPDKAEPRNRRIEIVIHARPG